MHLLPRTEWMLLKEDIILRDMFGCVLQVLADGGRVAYTVLFNTTATHGLPAALNSASNALLRSITSGSAADRRISVVNHPMPTLKDEAAVKFSRVAGISNHPS